MHTAEHILNQTMIRMFDCGRDFRAHIEAKKSKCDYRFDRELTLEEITEIEDRVNEIVEADLAVTESFVTREEADRLYNTAKLPETVGDNIRIVKVGDYDACACIGPHVSSSGEIGKFLIASADFNDAVLRIRFKLEATKLGV